MTDRDVQIAILVGSLRKESVNRALAQLAVAHAPTGVSVEIVENLGGLPFYNEDDDPSANASASLPDAVAAVRGAVGRADAVLVVTPEYNGTIPGVLKNAIDWLSRPYGEGAVQGKPVGVIGAALGRYAGTWSRTDTRKSVGVAGGRVVEDIEVGLRTGELGESGTDAPEIVEQVVAALGRLVDEVAVSA